LCLAETTDTPHLDLVGQVAQCLQQSILKRAAHQYGTVRIG
jgi:hypothetical protein